MQQQPPTGPQLPPFGQQPQQSSGNKAFAWFNRLPIPGKVGVGCGGLLALCLVMGMCSSLASLANGGAARTGGQTTATNAPAATHTPGGPTATPTPSYAHFGDGTFQVGKDIQPGTYRTRSGSSGCYYARLRGFSGALGDVIVNENTDDPAIVTIAATDKGFQSERCGTWTANLSQITKSKTPFEGGTFIVGTDIEPGTYKNTGDDGCYYARLRGFSGALGDIIANGNPTGVAIVTIKSSDKGFASARCGTWTKQ